MLIVVGLINLLIAAWMVAGYRRGDAIAALLIATNLGLGVVNLVRGLAA